MKGYVFTLEVLLAVAIVIIAMGLLEIFHEPINEPALHRLAEDSLAILKISGILQSNSTYQIEEILNSTVPHYHLTIYEFDQTPALQGSWVIGELVEGDSVVAKATWVTDDYFYLAILEVWQ